MKPKSSHVKSTISAAQRAKRLAFVKQLLDVSYREQMGLAPHKPMLEIAKKSC